jgi:hypothetical protein
MLLTSNPSVALAHGLLLLSVATAVLVAAVVHPASWSDPFRCLAAGALALLCLTRQPPVANMASFS